MRMKYNLAKIVEVLGHTPEELQWMKISPLGRQILVASGPLLSTISLGMTSGFSAILLPQLNATNSSIEITRNEASWIASMAVLPMVFGCLLGGFFMEKIGRKATQILTTIPCLLGWVTIAISSNLPMVLIGRFLTGLCGGLLGPSTSVYISETSEPLYRGFLLGAISLCIALGLFLVHLLGTFLHWKTVSVISSVFPVISVVLLILVPESPSWLAKNDKAEEARKAFFWCRGKSEESKKEIAEIVARASLKSDQKVKMSEYRKKEFLKPLMIIVVFFVTNQGAGVNALTFYTVSIMQRTLNDGIDNYVAMLIVDSIRVVMSILACVIIKHMRRRPLAVLSGVGTSLSLFILSAHSHNFESEASSWSHVAVPMAALVAYICFITVGLVPLPWAMMGEVFPLNTRNVGASVSSFMAFAAFFVVVKTSPAMFDALGADGTFLVYGAVAAVGTAFVAAVLPETKDRTLAEIEANFDLK